MDKFDQTELHPRGFPLWVEILLVSGLILAPVVVVALWQAWQDHQVKHSDGATHSTVVETETKMPDASTTVDSTESKPGVAETKTDTTSGTDTAESSQSTTNTPAASSTAGSADAKSGAAENKAETGDAAKTP